MLIGSTLAAAAVCAAVGMAASGAKDALGDAESTWTNIVPTGAEVEKIAGGFRFVEGPVWMPDHTLVFSDIPADTMYRWTGHGEPDIFRHPSNNANGNTLDLQVRLITCEHGSRKVTRTEQDGSISVIAERFEGRRLNSPNDVIVRANGDLYFTDPPYGVTPEEAEIGFNGVFRLSPDGTLTALVRDFDRPNGLAFSPDQRTLYVADTARLHMRAFDVLEDGTLANGRVFASVDGEKPGVPDGMRVDTMGNIYCTGSGGVQVFTPSGRHLGTIDVPEKAANCAWGGPDRQTLFITASTSLYRVRLLVAGS